MKQPEEHDLLHDLYENLEFCKLLERAQYIDQDEWQQWFALHKQYLPVSDLARTLYNLQYFEQSEFDGSLHAADVWSKVDQFIKQDESTDLKPSLLKRITRSWMPYAAMILAVLSVALWFSMPNSNQVADAIEFVARDEQRSVLLPDGSTVILNKNSQITYKEDDLGRQVELEGEAYLQVAKKIKNQVRMPFIVKGNGFEVKVLGTRFNMINNKHAKVIALDEGRVAVSQNEKKVIMEPGQVIKSEGNELKLVPIRAALMNAWQTGVLQLNNTRLEEIASWLEITQGVRVVNTLPKEIQVLTMSGQIDIRDQGNLYRSISSIYNIEIINHDDQIIFKKK